MLSQAAAAHPLDRPVWHALTGRQAAIAQVEAGACRMQPDYGPFGAFADPTTPSGTVAARLLARDEMWLIETEATDPPPGAVLVRRAVCCQLVATALAPAPPTIPMVALHEADANAMQALAALTRPGPFRARTHRLGQFFGVKRDGVLVAMAGERLKPGTFTEVSGVCCHPDHRGRGYARSLLAHVARQVLARGETPFLHSYADNDTAMRLYRSLGFRERRTVLLSVVA